MSYGYRSDLAYECAQSKLLWREALEKARATFFDPPPGWPPPLPRRLHFGPWRGVDDHAVAKPRSDDWPDRNVVRVNGKIVAVLRLGRSDTWNCEWWHEYETEQEAMDAFQTTYRECCAEAEEWAAEAEAAAEEEIDPEDAEAWAERYADYA